MCPIRESPSPLRHGRSTISAAFLPNSIKWNIRRPATPYFARRVQQLLAPMDVKLDNSWGLDHGTWSVLQHVYPVADIPVVQLSIDETKPPSFHFEIGKKLAPLRDEGVLIVGSGNLVHNLHTYAWGRPSARSLRLGGALRKRGKRLMLAGDFSR